MSRKAHITSVEAIDAFRAKLIVYLDKAGRVLDEVGEDALRTRLWLENDHRVYWESRVRRRAGELEQAKQERLHAQLSVLSETAGSEIPVLKARRALEEAQNKLERLKRWSRQYESRVDPLIKQLEKLRNFLVYDMEKAVTFLSQAITAIDAYADVRLPDASPVQPREAVADGGEGEPSGPASGGAPGPDTDRGDEDVRP